MTSPVAGTLLIRNSFLNLAGQLVPILVAIFTIPPLIHGLGTDRFGILTLAWMFIGYFSLFDVGLGRALTQIVAKKMNSGEKREVPALVWTALALMLVMGLSGSLAVSLISPWLVHSVLKIPAPLQGETLDAFYLLAASIPIVISTAGLAGVLVAVQRFGVLNAIRLPLGVFNFIAPLLILPFSKSLFVLTIVLVIGRLIGWGCHLAACFYVMPTLRFNFSLQRAAAKSLFQFGTWMTVTNVIGPLMIYLDRFVIGAVVSVSAVTYYATPFELVTKLLIFPIAIVTVLFPAFAATFLQDRDQTLVLFVRGTKYIFLMLFPIVLFLVAFAPEGLTLWLGIDFSQHGSSVLQWLAVGVFINGLAQVPFALIQGSGRPDLTAKLHFFELLAYIPLFLWLLDAHGIVGAAIAWTVRVAIDALLLFRVAWRFLSDNSVLFNRMAGAMAGALLGLMTPLLSNSLSVRVAITAVTLLAFVTVVWLRILTAGERNVIKSKARLFGL